MYNVVKLQTTVKIIGCLSCVSFTFMVNYVFYFNNKIGSLLQFAVLFFFFFWGGGVLAHTPYLYLLNKYGESVHWYLFKI